MEGNDNLAGQWLVSEPAENIPPDSRQNGVRTTSAVSSIGIGPSIT